MSIPFLLMRRPWAKRIRSLTSPVAMLTATEILILGLGWSDAEPSDQVYMVVQVRHASLVITQKSIYARSSEPAAPTVGG